MLTLQIRSWRKWPFAAAALSVLFISYGLSLVSRSQSVQQAIASEVDLLNELSHVNDQLHQLALVHRVDVGMQQYKWGAEMDALNGRIASIPKSFPASPEVSGLPAEIAPALHQADSLHRTAMLNGDHIADPRSVEAVFQIMMQRAQKVVDRTARSVHEQGLSAHTRTLSARWNEAQILLVAACLLAVVFAWLVGVRGRLLVESRLRSDQLSAAKQNLEKTNRDLRETMLSKEEKVVMIKEIHHRVKNNLQIVKSLIRFQMDQVKDAKTTELFNECVNRVSAMALVHEQTYLSKDLANIPVDSYLDHLVRDLVYAYSVNVKLKMDIDICVKTLSVDALVPLGLLINEVISNSFKYAFVGRDTGTIIVHLHGSEADGLRMRIGDDGVGLKSREGFHRPNSLGMDLIHTLAGQLDSNVRLLDEPGTMYELVPQQIQHRKRA
ncbi:MAG TPA: sensor histidine kinase, partial [Flavobacteriales bacterium]|nr:sensor histidine kinase [Flavobacteriales bacterium]